MGIQEQLGLSRLGALFLAVGTLVGCASASGGLSEAVELFNTGDYAVARDKADEVAKSWPDAPEAAAANELAALAELALAIKATSTEDFDTSLQHAREYESRSGSSERDMLSQKAGRTQSICPTDVCDHKLRIPSPATVGALGAVEYVTWLSGTLDGKEDAKGRDTSLVIAALDMVKNPAGDDAAGAWLKTQTCDAFADWSKWDECKDLTVSGKTLSDASDAISACKPASIMGNVCSDHDVQLRGGEVFVSRLRAEGALEDLPPNEVCSLVPTVNALFAEDEPTLQGEGIPEIGPAKWWSTFKAQSEPGAKLRISAAITVAATERHKDLVQLTEKTLPAAGFKPKVGIAAKYGCWYDGDNRQPRGWLPWSRQRCDYAGVTDWKVKEPAVKYMAPPEDMPAKYQSAADNMGRSLFFLTGVYRGFAGPGEDGTSFEEGLVMQGMAAENLVEAQSGANSAKAALNAACADWKIP